MAKTETLNELHASYGDIANLLDAAKIINWEWAQMSLPDPELARLRNATIGLLDALDTAASRHNTKFEAAINGETS